MFTQIRLIIIFFLFSKNCISKELILLIGDSNISSIQSNLLPNNFFSLPDQISQGDTLSILKNIDTINSYIILNNFDKVIIHVGTNDLFFHNAKLEKVLDNFITIIKLLNRKTIVTELLPRSDDYENKIKNFNILLRQHFISLEFDIITLHNYYLTNDLFNNKLFIDDLHLNLDGQKLFFKIIINHLNLIK
jgi:lysophospholipase L1-like esterase